MALDVSGQVWAWGDNSVGELGNNDDSTDTPFAVPGMTNITSISGGNDVSMAVDSSGIGWQWGQIYPGANSVPQPVPLYVDFYQGVLPTVSIVGGNNQIGYTDVGFASPLVFQVTDTNGAPLTNAPVSVEVIAGDIGIGSSGILGERFTTDTNGNISFTIVVTGSVNTNCDIKILAESCEKYVRVDFSETIQLAPVAPGSLSAQALSSYALKLSWTAPVGSPTGYIIERTIGSGGTYSPVGTTGSTTFVDTLADGVTAYYYKVSATNDYGATTSTSLAPPTVYINNLTNGTIWNAGANYTADATASGVEDGVVAVDFYNYVAHLGGVSTSPYDFTINSVTTLYQSINAKATDGQGNTRISIPVFVIVSTNTSGDGRNDALDIMLGLDPSTNAVPIDPGDTTPPTINLLQPSDATLVP